MEIGKVHQNIVKGRMFSYGRFLGIHIRSDELGKAEDPYINRRTLERFSLSNNIKIQNAVADNISGRLRSPYSKAQIEHIFSSFDRKIIARVLSSEIFTDPWLKVPIHQFISQTSAIEELSSNIHRKALVRLTSYPRDLDPEIAMDAYCLLHRDMTPSELEEIAQIGPSSDIAAHMMGAYKMTKKSLLFLALHDYGADNAVSLNIYSNLKKALSGEEMLILSQSKNKIILENICKNPKSSPEVAANAALGLVEKNGNEYDMKAVEKICLLIEARPTGRTEVIRIIYDKDFHLASLIFGHYLRPGKNYPPFSY